MRVKNIVIITAIVVIITPLRKPNQGLTEKYENKGYTPRILNNGTVKRFVVT